MHVGARALTMPETELEQRERDEDLLEDAKGGSEPAFVELISRHYVDVLRYLMRHAADPDQAHELTQETFLDAYQAIESIPKGRSFRKWLFVTARYNLLHRLRQERIRRHTSFEQLMEYGFQPPKQLAIDDPTLRYVDDETLRTILNDLSPPLRNVLLLVGKGYSIKEAAEMLDIDYQAARKRVSRAMRFIRERYAQLGIFPEEHR